MTDAQKDQRSDCPAEPRVWLQKHSAYPLAKFQQLADELVQLLLRTILRADRPLACSVKIPFWGIFSALPISEASEKLIPAFEL